MWYAIISLVSIKTLFSFLHLSEEILYTGLLKSNNTINFICVFLVFNCIIFVLFYFFDRSLQDRLQNPSPFTVSIVQETFLLQISILSSLSIYFYCLFDSIKILLYEKKTLSKYIIWEEKYSLEMFSLSLTRWWNSHFYLYIGNIWQKHHYYNISSLTSSS